MSAKKPRGKRVSVKAIGVFDHRAKCPARVFPKSGYTKWARLYFPLKEVRPITISYLIPGASRVQK